jgi:hypothetical protein
VKTLDRIRDRLLNGEVIRTFDSTTGVRWVEWYLAAEQEILDYGGNPGKTYVVESVVFESGFDPYGPRLWELDAAAQFIAERSTLI